MGVCGRLHALKPVLCSCVGHLLQANCVVLPDHDGSRLLVGAVRRSRLDVAGYCYEF